MTPQTLDSPKFLDIAINEINDKLKLKFSWLNEAFGRAERYTERPNDGNYKEVTGYGILEYPAIYSGNNQYIKLFPDATIGNFSFVVSDSFEVKEIKYQAINGTSNIDFVFWFDFRAVYPDNFETRDVINVIWDVMKFFNETSFSNCHINVQGYDTRVDEIYKGFSHNEIKDQFSMRPYGCFKMTNKITLKEMC